MGSKPIEDDYYINLFNELVHINDKALWKRALR